MLLLLANYYSQYALCIPPETAYHQWTLYLSARVLNAALPYIALFFACFRS